MKAHCIQADYVKKYKLTSVFSTYVVSCTTERNGNNNHGFF